MARRKYPSDLDPFIRERFKEYTARQLTLMIKDELGIEMTPEQVRAYTKNHGIHYGRLGKTVPGRRITTPKIDDFIHKHYKGTGHREMANLVNEHFGTNYTYKQMKSYYGRNHLNSGLTGRFEAGHTPQNKGKTWDEYMGPEGQKAARQTQFKPGRIPHNGGTPVGEIRLRKASARPHAKPYYWQKTAQPNVWRPKHIIEWERHNGPVPDGCMVTFADGDTTNWRIGNLLLETKAQHAIKNRSHIRGIDVETGEVANQIANLKMAIHKARKQRKRSGSADAV